MNHSMLTKKPSVLSVLSLGSVHGEDLQTSEPGERACGEINRKWPEGLLRCLRGSATAICIQKSCRCGDQPHPTASLDTKKRTLLRILPTVPERAIAEVQGFYLCLLVPWYNNTKTHKHLVIVSVWLCAAIDVYWLFFHSLLSRYCFSHERQLKVAKLECFFCARVHP